MKRSIAALTGVLLSSVVVGNAWGEVRYNVTDLGLLGGYDTRAFGINNSGQVVAGSVLYSGGVMTNLSFTAYGINDSGQVVGGNWGDGAFLYQNGTVTNLGTLGGGFGLAFDINNSGQVVGYSTLTGDRVAHAFLYQDGTMTDLGTLGGDNSQAFGINNSGQVAGTAQTAEAFNRAFFYGGGMADLGTLGGYDSIAYGINDSGQVVGYAYTADNNATFAFLYNGAMSNLGTLGGGSSFALGINNSGQVVGYSNEHAFLYQNGTITDLNSLIDPSSGFTLSIAGAINNNGVIVGRGTVNGQHHAFLLTPVPEPSTIILLVIGAAGVLAFAWRRRQPA
jgi:probable HAF family extracellular repeat protein